MGTAPQRPGSSALYILRTFAIGTLGGAAFVALGVPMGWMLGALAACMLATKVVDNVRVPGVFRSILQPILGVMLGSFFTPALFGQIANWAEVMAFLTAFVIIATMFGVFYFRKIARYDLTTSFFAAVPGGLSDITLLGASLGANIVLLGLIHSVRVVMVVAVVPFLVAAAAGGGGTAVAAPVAPPLEPADILVLGLCGCVGYILGRVTRLPAGGMLCPLAVSAGVHLMGWSDSAPPASLISVVQVVLGSYIGARFADLGWKDFRSALGHGMVWSTGLIILSALFALLCAWSSDFGAAQLLLAFSPGGIAEMGLLTLALGSDVALVTSCHVLRLLLVYLLMPVIAHRVSARATPRIPDTGLTDD